MELLCYPMGSRPPEIVPARAQRRWKDNFSNRHPYKCLPLTMASTTGWEILSPWDVTIEWTGGRSQSDISFRFDRPIPDQDHFIASHFAGGVVTFHPGYLFRTPPGWAMWASGPPNHVKDGIQPLTGLVETDWLPFPFTMNRIFTRPGMVKWERGEPFCFITLVQNRAMEQVQPVMRSLERDQELHGQFNAWNRQRGEFNRRLAANDPDTVRESWQRFYFKGELPEEAPGSAPEDHVNKRRLKPIRLT